MLRSAIAALPLLAVNISPNNSAAHVLLTPQILSVKPSILLSFLIYFLSLNQETPLFHIFNFSQLAGVLKILISNQT